MKLKHSPTTHATVRQMWSEGATSTAIAAKLHVTRYVVIGIAHRLHLPARPSPIRPSVERPLTLDTRVCYPAGHPVTWGLLTEGTCLEGARYEP